MSSSCRFEAILTETRETRCQCVRAGGVTRDLHPLDSLGGVIGDLDIDTDGLTMVVQLERDRDLAMCVSMSSNSTSKCVFLLPPYLVRPLGVKIYRTSGSCDWSPPLAVGLASLGHTELSWSPTAQCSYIHSKFIFIYIYGGNISTSSTSQQHS